MTLPRQILPGRFYTVTRSCSEDRFFLRPDSQTNNMFVYLLAESAARFQIEVVIAQQMSNHHHTTVFDRYGNIVEFMAHLHKFIAKCQNAYFGHWENLWSCEPPCLTELVEPSDVIAQMIYVATNPVKDGLVEKVHHWPGAPLVPAFLANRELVARRPSHFFRNNGKMPAQAVLQFTIPPELGERDAVVQAVREGIELFEKAEAERRAVTGKRVFGRANVRRASWKSQPVKRAPRRNLRPRFAAKSLTARCETIERYRAFLRAYRAARAARFATQIPFPPGTYWMVKYGGASVADSLAA